jgi:hypothetical protein
MLSIDYGNACFDQVTRYSTVLVLLYSVFSESMYCTRTSLEYEYCTRVQQYTPAPVSGVEPLSISYDTKHILVLVLVQVQVLQ